MTTPKRASVAQSAPPPLMGPRPGGGPMGFFKEPEKSKNTRATLIRLWGYVKRQFWTLIGSLILVILTALTSLLGPYLMSIAIDRYILKFDLPGLAWMLGIMLVTYILGSVGTWLQAYLMVGVAQYAVRDIRTDLFDRLQTLPVSYFDQHPHGDLMSRLTNDVENIANVLAVGFSQLVSSVLTLVGIVIFMVLLNPLLAAISLVVMPIAYLLTRTIAKQTRPGFREMQQTLGGLNGIIEENVTGARTVKAFVREKTAVEQFSQVNRQYQRVSRKTRIYAGSMGPLMNLVNNLGLAIVACSGGWLAVQGYATVGEVAAFISYSGRLSWPLNQIAQLFNSILSALAGAERIFELMDAAPETDAVGAKPLLKVNGHVIFERVNFSYQPGSPVLKNVNLEAKEGQMVALVGPTGAGKTTIANLLTRFYDVDEGAIKIDGTDVGLICKDDLRRKLGLVLQDNFLFADTVMENIRYGRLTATDEEVMAAAKLANADHFIHRLPHGFQTVLTERGSNLSQGQRQLLAISRAVLSDPDILILDEATSNVDTRTEKHLQEALLNLMKGRTSFVIAHRLSTIRDADQVLVIQDGEIVEKGNHQSLLAQRGFYHHLYVSQFKGQNVPEDLAV